MITIGLNSSCLQKHNNTSIREIVEFVLEHGFKGVEFRDEYPFCENLTNEEIEWVRNTVKSFGLICSVHLPYYDLNLSAFRDELRLAAVHCILKSVRAAHRIGARTVTIHSGSMRRNYYADNWEERAEKLTNESLRVIVNECEQYGITLLIENMNVFKKEVHRVHATPASMLNTLKVLDGKIGFTYDIAHAVSTSIDPVTFVETLGSDKIYLAHLNDNDLKSDQHLAVGDGKIDYRSFMKAYIDRGWKFPLFCESQRAESALASKVYLQKIIEEYGA
ncbi:MAG: sugar phosphate isomerase/epimerase family protein [Spirochaetota bacterium]